MGFSNPARWDYRTVSVCALALYETIHTLSDRQVESDELANPIYCTEEYDTTINLANGTVHLHISKVNGASSNGTFNRDAYSCPELPEIILNEERA